MTEEDSYEEAISNEVDRVQDRIEFLKANRDQLDNLLQVCEELDRIGSVNVDSADTAEQDVTSLRVTANVDSITYEVVEELLNMADRNGEVDTNNREGGFTVTAVILAG